MIIEHNRREKNVYCGRSQFYHIIDFAEVNEISERGYYGDV